MGEQTGKDKYSEPFELKNKSPKESEVSLLLPFSTDAKLRDIYMNAFNGVRIGRILEDLDAMAGEIACT